VPRPHRSRRRGGRRAVDGAAGAYWKRAGRLGGCGVASGEAPCRVFIEASGAAGGAQSTWQLARKSTWRLARAESMLADSAASVASCEAPRRVFIEASGAAGGARPTWQLARHAASPSGPAARCDAPRRVSIGAGGVTGGAQSTGQLAHTESALAARRLWRREWRRAAPRLHRSQRRGGRRAVDSAAGACKMRAGGSAARVASGSRRERRCTTSRLHRGQRRGEQRAVVSATGACEEHAGGSAAGVARCDTPRRVSVGASGVAGGTQSGGAQSSAAMRHAASPLEPAAWWAARGRAARSLALRCATPVSVGASGMAGGAQPTWQLARIGRAGGSAAGVASCVAPNRVSIGASGAAGGVRSTWQLARVGGVLAARRLAASRAVTCRTRLLWSQRCGWRRRHAAPVSVGARVQLRDDCGVALDAITSGLGAARQDRQRVRRRRCNECCKSYARALHRDDRG